MDYNNTKRVVCAITEDKKLLMLFGYNKNIKTYSVELPICESEKQFNLFMKEAGFHYNCIFNLAYGYNTVDDSIELLEYQLVPGYLDKELTFDNTKTDISGNVARQVIEYPLDSLERIWPGEGRYLGDAKTAAGVGYVINRIRNDEDEEELFPMKEWWIKPTSI